jgi:hypothetical protein
VPELALDDVERHAFTGELNGVGLAQLMRRHALPAGVVRLAKPPAPAQTGSGTCGVQHMMKWR